MKLKVEKTNLLENLCQQNYVDCHPNERLVTISWVLAAHSPYNNNDNLGPLFIKHIIEDTKHIYFFLYIVTQSLKAHYLKKHIISSFKLTLHLIELLDIELYLICF